MHHAELLTNTRCLLLQTIRFTLLSMSCQLPSSPPAVEMRCHLTKRPSALRFKTESPTVATTNSVAIYFATTAKLASALEGLPPLMAL